MAVSSAPRFELVEDWRKLPEGYLEPDAVGVAVDSRDRVYVFIRGKNSRVTVFERDGSYVTSWGEGHFVSHTHAIFIGADDGVWCVEDVNHTIKKFTTDGKLLLTLGTPGVASDSGFDGKELDTIVRAAPPFNKPTNFGIAPNGDLYVSDGYGNASVHRFSPEGKLLKTWGGPGNGPGQFHIPHDVKVLPDGRVLVSDRENERIQVFTPDGEFLEEWNDLQRPTGMCVGRDGLLYVAELWWYPGQRSYKQGIVEKFQNGRVGILDFNGNVVGRLGGEGHGPGDFPLPHQVAMDSHGDIYVAEVTFSMGTRLDRLPNEGIHTLQKLVRKG